VDGELVTLMEVLSPANKLYGPGRNAYLRKREDVLGSRTSLIEIDLLRAGEPMPLVGPLLARPLDEWARVCVTAAS